MTPSPSRVRASRRAATVFVEVGLRGEPGPGDAPNISALNEPELPELIARYRELHARRTKLQSRVEGLEETARRLVLDDDRVLHENTIT